MNEEAVKFGQMRSLVGIVTPHKGIESEHARTAVIFLNAGIVHRVGAGRVYVKLARALASSGFVCLRFDFSGIGDSATRNDNLRFDKSAVAEARKAIDFLFETEGIREFILLGGCSGAKIAFDTASCDDRIKGVLLINYPSAEDDDGVQDTDAAHAGASFYYRKSALFSLRSWLRLLTGQANYLQLLRSLWWQAKRRIAPDESVSEQAAQFRLGLRQVIERHIQVTFICSQGDRRLEDLKIAGGKEFKRLRAERRVALHIIKGSDHTFSSLDDQQQLMNVVLSRADAVVQRKTQFADHSVTSAAARVLSHQLQS